MDRLFLLVTMFFITMNISAQDYKALNAFMSEYSSTWAGSRHSDGGFAASQIGSKCPDFYLNKQYNSKRLKGKFVLMNFWATWCNGCRLLAIDLDSLMRRKSHEFDDMALIGVNCIESGIKGYNPDEWWKEKGIRYPSIGGSGSDSLYVHVKGSHPCMILIDDKGFIRGRWDAWTPTAAEEARLAAWTLHVVPRDGIKADRQTIEKYLAEGRDMEAVYLSYLIPDNLENAELKFRAISKISTGNALAYLDKLRKEYERDRKDGSMGFWNADSNYIDVLQKIVDDIYSFKTTDRYYLQAGNSAINAILNARCRMNNPGNRLLRIKANLLSFRYGKIVETSAQKALNRMSQSTEYGLNKEEKAWLGQEMEKFGVEKLKPCELAYKEERSHNVYDVDAENMAHMVGLNDTIALKTTPNGILSGDVLFPQKMSYGCKYKIDLRLVLAKGWHAYADTEKTFKDGFIPTTIEVVLPKEFKKVGKALSWPEGDILENNFDLSQTFTCPTEKVLKGKKEFPVKVILTYEACDAGHCLPPFSVEIAGKIRIKK